MSQRWRGGGPKYRFGDERKPIVDRPPVLMPGDCWCGEFHGFTEGGAARTHWEALPELVDNGEGSA